MKTTPFTVKASIEASGRQASCGDSQRDGAYWRFVAQFDPTVDLVTGGLR